MLTIRNAQMAVFQQRRIDEFVDDLVRHLQTNFSEPAAVVGGEAELKTFAKRAIDKGAEYGIDTKGGVMILAELMIQFGEDLERSPPREWTMNILNTPNLPGQMKAETVRDKHDALTGGRIVIRY